MKLSEVEIWEDQLDVAGIYAPVAWLREHLAKAPAGAPSRDILAGELAGR